MQEPVSDGGGLAGLDLLFTTGGLAVRRMSDDPEDYRLLARWLSDPRVLEWVYGRDSPRDYDAVIAKFRPRVLGEDPVEPCIVFWEGRPIGYVQVYTAPEEILAEVDAVRGVWAIDLFIGEPEYWDRGIGTQLVTSVLRWLFDSRDASMVTIDPRLNNPRAVRTYEKAGFRKRTVLQAHELHEGVWHDNWLMTVSHEEFVTSHTGR